MSHPLWYTIRMKEIKNMKNDLHSFEIWILICLILFIATVATGFYIESI